MTRQPNGDAEDPPTDRPSGRRGNLSRVAILATLLAMAVAVVIGVVVLVDADRGGITGFERVDRSTLFPGLAAPADRIQGAIITGPAGPVHLEKWPSGWRYIQRDGYPVAAGRVPRLIEAIASMTSVYVSTPSEPPYREYGVARPEDSASGRGTTVALLDSEGVALAQITLGNPITVPGETRTRTLLPVRRDDEARIWLAESGIELPALALDWLDRRILDVPQGAIAALAITPPGEDAWHVRRDSDNALYISSDPSSSEDAAQPRVLNEIVAAFDNVTFLDVRLAVGVEEAAEDIWRIDVVTDEGPTYHVTLYRWADEHWATLFASTPDGELSPQARDFNARHAAWAYRLSPHLGGLLSTLVAEQRR